MRIILKPGGVIVLLAAIVALTVLAFQHARGDSGSPGGGPAADPVASSAAVAAATTAPTVVGERAEHGHAIYRHGLQNGWENWSWEKNVDFQSHEVTRSGPNAIRAAFSSYGGVKFHHAPLDARSFDRVSLLIHGGPKGGQLLSVAGAYTVGKVDVASPSAVHLPLLPPNRWSAVVIPLKELGIADRPDLTAVWIQGDVPGTQSPVYIDEVRLLRPDEPNPDLPVLQPSPNGRR